MRLRHYSPVTTGVLRKAGRQLLFPIILVSLWSLPTISSAEVVQVGTDTVQMLGSDLRELVTQIQENEAENNALREALSSERASLSLYQQSVDGLIKAQQEERKALLNALNRPRLELYGGYNTKDKAEGGIRLVWVIK